MKERPIPFSAPMVRAILDDRKTQTRRVVKPQPHHGPVGTMVHLGDGAWAMDDGDLSGQWQCPYGVPGDRLWVRETWKPHSLYADRPPREMPQSRVFYRADDGYAPSNTKWWPGIHMPRWASRITLEITGVRVERLNDISEADALAEGIERLRYPERGDWGWPQKKFQELWEAINGPGSWDANPWVWVVTFDRVTP